MKMNILLYVSKFIPADLNNKRKVKINKETNTLNILGEYYNASDFSGISCRIVNIFSFRRWKMIQERSILQGHHGHSARTHFALE